MYLALLTPSLTQRLKWGSLKYNGVDTYKKRFECGRRVEMRQNICDTVEDKQHSLNASRLKTSHEKLSQILTSQK